MRKRVNDRGCVTSIGTDVAQSVGAGSLGVGAGGQGVKQSVGLLEAAQAGNALHPAEVTASVHNGSELLRRSSQRELHHVLAAPRRHGALQVLGLDVHTCCESSEVVLHLLDASLAAFHGFQEPLAQRSIGGCVRMGSWLKTVSVHHVGPYHLKTHST